MGKEKDNPATTDARNDQATDKKKRRWLRWLIAVVVLLVVLVFIAPYIAASGPVRRWILSSVNSSIRGKVEIGELSLGWFSAPRIGQIVVQDPDGKEVLSVREVRTEKSLLSLVLSPMHFGRVEVQDPNVRLISSASGGYSINKAFESTSPPKPKKPSGKLPDIHGTIVVRGASITMTDLTGRRLALTDATSDVDIQSLDKLTGTQTVRLPGGSVVTTKYALTGLAPGGELQPGNVSGTIEVATDKPADLKPLGEFALPGKGLTGTANLSVNVKFDRGKPDGRFELALVDVKADQGYAAKVKPVSFAITATAAADGNAVRGEMHLASQAGGIGRFDGTYDYQAGAGSELSGEKFIAAAADRRTAAPAACVPGRQRPGQPGRGSSRRAFAAATQARRDRHRRDRLTEHARDSRRGEAVAQDRRRDAGRRRLPHGGQRHAAHNRHQADPGDVRLSPRGRHGPGHPPAEVRQRLCAPRRLRLAQELPRPIRRGPRGRRRGDRQDHRPRQADNRRARQRRGRHQHRQGSDARLQHRRQCDGARGGQRRSPGQGRPQRA